MKTLLSFTTSIISLVLLTPTASAQWLETPEVPKPNHKTVDSLNFSASTLPSLESHQVITSSHHPTQGGWLADETTMMSQTISRTQFVNQPWSYLGLGANVGLDGVTQLGESSVVVNSKIALNSSLSVRPGVWIGDKVAITLPITYDFQIEGSDPFVPAKFHPFVGAGAVFTTDGDTSATDDAANNFGPLLMGGVDIRLSDQWVFNTSANVGFLDDRTEAGIVLGIGYVFSGF